MALLLVLALVSFVYVRVEAGQGGTFVQTQRSVQPLTPVGVAWVVRMAPETSGGPRGQRASCVALGHVGLRNPWRCSVTYPDGVRDQYTVRIHLNGSYTGSDQVVDRQGQITHGNGQISGCCVVVP